MSASFDGVVGSSCWPCLHGRVVRKSILLKRGRFAQKKEDGLTVMASFRWDTFQKIPPNQSSRILKRVTGEEKTFCVWEILLWIKKDLYMRTLQRTQKSRRMWILLSHAPRALAKCSWRISRRARRELRKKFSPIFFSPISTEIHCSLSLSFSWLLLEGRMKCVNSPRAGLRNALWISQCSMRAVSFEIIRNGTASCSVMYSCETTRRNAAVKS